ncbi:hypothetical protein SPI_07038 [Niveomyces insectorum RCEF 264]|uniref:F-box domain-containing protein n=1 Tax=Niveomyces insectorum RCEF 264 TaxID=1081102 RepID=A0A167Q7Q5_9HYPO|nr:hypothetical protein SPI_07038 [Niveomyces insectorum RCEF 264]
MAERRLTLLGLPSELRSEIFSHLVVRDTPVEPWDTFNYLQNFSPALLRVSRLVYREASFLLYSQNRFDVTVAQPDDVVSFLRKIGRRNAAYVRHVIIDFPFYEEGPLDVTLDEVNLRILAAFQKFCPNLRTLTTSIACKDGAGSILDDLKTEQLKTEVVGHVNAHFRAITSLRKIVVEVHKKWEDAALKETMERCGWTVKAATDGDDDEWNNSTEGEDDDDDEGDEDSDEGSDDGDDEDESDESDDGDEDGDDEVSDSDVDMDKGSQLVFFPGLAPGSVGFV